jgi:hypothetical protein
MFIALARCPDNHYPTARNTTKQWRHRCGGLFMTVICRIVKPAKADVIP